MERKPVSSHNVRVDGININRNNTESFKVSHVGLHGTAAVVGGAIEVGSYSLDGKRRYLADDSMKRYYVEPSLRVNFDLRRGYKTSVMNGYDMNERLNPLLTWLHHNRTKVQTSDQQNTGENRLIMDFVSARGHFTKLLLSPYEKLHPWKMCVTLFNGTIFISEIETKKSKQERLQMGPKHTELTYWGYKFEDYVTESIHDSCDKSDIVNTNKAFYSVVQTRVQNNSILMAAEVDCCIKQNNKPSSNYVELKTSRLMYNDYERRNFARYKLKKFWAQSFLAGVRKVVVGFRDDNGIVKELNSFDTLEIPHEAKQYGDFWNANLCLTFLDRFLNWLKELVQIDDPNVGYILTFDEPFQEITVKVILDGSERFLPSWFTDVKPSDHSGKLIYS